MNKSRSTLFLMELILAILFFSIASAVCVQMFVKSHLLSKESRELNHAVIWCESMAETFYGCNGDLSKVSEILSSPGLVKETSEELQICYDKEFKETSLDNAAYMVSGKLSSDEDLLTLNITCVDLYNNNTFYEITATLYPKNIKE